MNAYAFKSVFKIKCRLVRYIHAQNTATVTLYTDAVDEDVQYVSHQGSRTVQLHTTHTVLTMRTLTVTLTPYENPNRDPNPI